MWVVYLNICFCVVCSHENLCLVHSFKCPLPVPLEFEKIISEGERGKKEKNLMSQDPMFRWVFRF